MSALLLFDWTILQPSVAAGSILTAVLGAVTLLVTKTYPWLRAKRDARSVIERMRSEPFPRSRIERSLRYYIRPHCQDLDPAGGEEIRLVYGTKQKLFSALDDVVRNDTQYRYLILLADSGMGKTSALLNYYARHIRRWRNPGFEMALIPLSDPKADALIEAIPQKRNTVLLLDALDEDVLAIVDHRERLRLLVKATEDFRQVVISCRTQFFPKDEEIPRETGTIKVGPRAAGEAAAHYFHKLYLSPFSDEEVDAYLRRRFPVLFAYKSRKKAQAVAAKIPHLSARPMLLSHVEDIVDDERPIEYTFELYDEMISAWIERERGIVDGEALMKFSEELAVDLVHNRERRGSERIPRDELRTLAHQWDIPIDEWKLSGRSLLNRDAEGNYKFAHRSIMEHLFAKRLVAGDKRCIDIQWTDQIEAFARQRLEFPNRPANHSIDNALATDPIRVQQFVAHLIATHPRAESQTEVLRPRSQARALFAAIEDYEAARAVVKDEKQLLLHLFRSAVEFRGLGATIRSSQASAEIETLLRSKPGLATSRVLGGIALQAWLAGLDEVAVMCLETRAGYAEAEDNAPRDIDSLLALGIISSSREDPEASMQYFRRVADEVRLRDRFEPVFVYVSVLVEIDRSREDPRVGSVAQLIDSVVSGGSIRSELDDLCQRDRALVRIIEGLREKPKGLIVTLPPTEAPGL